MFQRRAAEATATIDAPDSTRIMEEALLGMLGGDAAPTPIQRAARTASPYLMHSRNPDADRAAAAAEVDVRAATHAVRAAQAAHASATAAAENLRAERAAATHLSLIHI